MKMNCHGAAFVTEMQHCAATTAMMICTAPDVSQRAMNNLVCLTIAMCHTNLTQKPSKHKIHYFLLEMMLESIGVCHVMLNFTSEFESTN